MAQFSQHELRFFINHLFLPPKLPQEDDHDSRLDDRLLCLVTESLAKFTQLLPAEQRSGAHKVAEAIARLVDCRDPDAKGAVDEAQLLRSLATLSDAESGTTIPLYIAAQNAGILISKQSHGFDFEAFELAAENSAVMSTTGRLRRCFPGPALTIDMVYFNDPEFQSTLAKTLSTLSSQEASAMMPTVRKSQQDVKEIRDTTHPGLVTELQISFLVPISEPSDVQRIQKHIREEVLWKNAKLPWHRSPLWLLVRVTMQLLFHRSDSSDGSIGVQGYKLFILHLLATVLDKALSQGTPLELAHCMSAKIARRMLKLESDDGHPGISFVKAVLEKTRVYVSQKWLAVQDRNAKTLNLARLSRLNFGQDVTLSLPELDAHLALMSTRECAADLSEFTPTPDLMVFTASNLPYVELSDASDYKTYNLSSLEDWVSRHLSTWLAKNRTSSKTCLNLKRLMQQYYQAALSADQDNPERRSIAFLTLLEMWIALDESALAQLPMLKDYDPGIPLEHLQLLILPKQGQMIRLQRVERYIQRRRDQSTHGSAGSVFQDFGTKKCLSVRYFDRSEHHQRIKTRIEADASEERQRKRQEFRDKKRRYGELMDKYNALSCESQYVTNFKGRTHSVHSYSCQRCAYLQEADNISIRVHEWPLPTKELELKSVVFELDTPIGFCSWRDATTFLIQNVLGSKYEAQQRPRALFPLQQYSALQSYLSSPDSRIGLLSEDKPHVKTHRGLHLSMSSVTEICVNNGLHFRYFDADPACFVSGISRTDSVLKACTYQMPSKSAVFSQFLERNFQGQDSTPNGVIATQSECPEHLSLAEYRSLASIPVGYRLQWMNVLQQLACPEIDLKKTETSLVVLQSIYQAGPPELSDFRRGGHQILTDPQFANRLLDGVSESARRIEENWDSISALGMLISIVGRLLSLTPSTSPSIEALAMETLSGLRNIAFSWVKTLREKFGQAETDDQRAQFLTKMVQAALVTCQTFDVDDKHLDAIASNSADASVLIQCGIFNHDYYAKKSASAHDYLTPILFRRWQQVSYRMYPLLSRRVVGQETSTGLDGAIKASWPDYQRGTPWATAAAGADHWVVSSTSAQSGRSMKVHYDLMTGRLLVNGSPLSRLPSEYEKNPLYAELFGNEVFEIVPSSKAGMRFSSRRSYSDHGHSLEFGMDGQRLMVQASKHDQVWELVPRDLFQNRLPQEFVNEHFHWYNVKTGLVEFRRRTNPWSIDNDTWRLSVTSGAVWLLEKQGNTLVNPASPTGQALASVLSPLQQPLWINMVLTPDRKTLEIDLPRLKTDFRLKEGTMSVVSRKQRGFEIDSRQSFGTLIGLKTMLVLKKPLSNDRKVLIPEGNVCKG